MYNSLIIDQTIVHELTIVQTIIIIVIYIDQLQLQLYMCDHDSLINSTSLHTIYVVDQ